MMTTMMMDMTGKIKMVMVMRLRRNLMSGLEVIETEIETSGREGGEEDLENHQGYEYFSVIQITNQLSIFVA